MMKANSFRLLLFVLPMLFPHLSFSQTPQITKVGCSEYRAFYLCNDRKVYAALWNGKVNGNTAQPYNITTPVVDVSGGLYQGVAVDANGYAYSLVNSSQTATKVTLDANGDPFTGNISCAGYFGTNFTVKSDGTVWFWGGDDYDQIAGTNSVPAPVQLKAPGNVKFTKISCGNTLLALTTDGDVYEYTTGNKNPEKKKLPRPASDIASGNGFQIAIVPDDINTSTDGWPYGWGYNGTYMGLDGLITNPVALKSTWGITSPVRRITTSHNNTHFIDANGVLWGMGDNAEGEVGIGTEKINHAETYATPYIWDWVAEGDMEIKPVQIAKGIVFKDIFAGGSYAFYHYAIDVNNKVYSWGRNKGITLGNGKAINEEAIYPNALDILKPTEVSPMTVQTNGYPFKPYTINAGASQIITLPVSSVTMNGSAVPSSGYTIASYKWTLVSGPTSYIIETPSSPKTVISGLVAGVYVFRLQMTDNNTATISGNVTIVVLPSLDILNKSPVAKAGSNQSITLPVNNVTLDGSGSTDEDGNIASYKWVKTDGPAAGAIASATSAKTSVTGLVEGVYTFALLVTDNRGATGIGQVKVTVNAGATGPPPDTIPPVDTNEPPVADAGPDQTVYLPTNEVTLNARNTHDAETPFALLVMKWTVISGPAGYWLTNPPNTITNVNKLVKGQYVVTLKVTDPDGGSDMDTVKITVNEAAPINRLPTAKAGADQHITLPESSVTLDGSGSTDVDGTVTSYSWSKASGPASGIIATAGSAKTNVTGLSAGVYVYTLTVKDNQGGTASDQVQVTVDTPVVENKPPVAKAGADQHITLPVSSVTLDGSGSSDPDGSVVSYNWSKVSGPSSGVIVAAGSNKTTVTGLTAGVYVFRLTVKDDEGLAASAQVQVTVDSPVVENKPPVAKAGADQRITLPVSSVALDGSGSSDPDGAVASYSWSKSSGPAGGTIVSASGAKTNVTGLTAGVYVFTLTVKDDDGVAASDQVQVTVDTAVVENKPPVAKAGADQHITLPVSSVALDGSGSTDADGNVASYTWSKASGPSSGVIVAAGSAKTNVTGLSAGVYVFMLTVKDNDGATASDQVQVTVDTAVVENKPPVAKAGADQHITLPVSSVALDGSGSTDEDGTVASYTWSKTSGPTSGVIVAAGSAKTSVTGLVAGTYVFTLLVKDNNSAAATDQVQVTVDPAPVVDTPVDKAPVANAGADQTVTLPANEVTLNASNSYDPDGVNVSLSYQWTVVSGPAGYWLTNPDNAITFMNSLVEGVYLVTLKVRDDKGVSSMDTVKITVLASGNGQQAVEDDLKVFPNPVVAATTLSFSSSYLGKSEIQLFNSSGKEVYHRSITKGTVTQQILIDMSGLPAGIYFLSASTYMDKKPMRKAIVKE